VTAGKKDDVAVSFLAKKEEVSLSPDKKEELAGDVLKNEHEQRLNDAKKLKEQRCVVTPPPELDLLKKNVCDIGSETLTALLDDDEDEYMVQCSQEIEEKLNKNSAVVCSSNSELPLPDYKTNSHVSVESKIRSPKVGKPASYLKCFNNSMKKPNSPKIGTKYCIQIKSGTPKYSKDDHCHSRVSLNHSSARPKIRYSRTNTDSTIINSKPLTDSEIAFDDSFDAVIQNLSEEDIEMMSQDHIFENKHTDKETGKESFQKVEGRTQMNSKRGVVGQSLPIYRSEFNNRPVHDINSSRALKHVNHGTVPNEVGAPAVSKMQFRLKVPSRMCNDQSLSERRSSVSTVQLNKPQLNKVTPLVNNKAFVMRQGQGNSAAVKNCNVAQPGSSTSLSSLPRKYYV
jgi:hypothetical protein